ncbi:MAG: hypothetical protein M1833_004740 [Piccolia ochrophora]|nr:MAG: hypothetical protein M1833_004740 [Piccolia ochrophora]
MSTTLVGVIPPPPGVTANFVNPESNAWQDYPPAAVALFLSTLFLAIRLYTKARILHMWGLEDPRIRIGKGRHLWNVPKTPEFRFFSLVGLYLAPGATEN